MDYLCGVGVVGVDVLVKVFGGGYGVGGFRRWVLGPLLEARLVDVVEGGVRVSGVGFKVGEFIGRFGVPGVFSRSSRCYEVVVLLELDRCGGVGLRGLRGLVPWGSLRRVLRRLREFVVGVRVGGGWVYRGGGGVVDGLDGRVLDLVKSGVGSAGVIAGLLGVHRRTVYKCLSRLRGAGLVESVRGGLVYRLSGEGLELAGYLKCLLGYLRGLVKLDVSVGLSFLKCLAERGYPVSEREVYEDCFRSGVDLNRFGYVRESLKRLGFVVGNVYTGYTVSRLFWDTVKNM
ncbi:MAG: helix-turn-helix domain-containing protein [Candidatus Odinarchaeum yellowstonii]|uniref:Helix-turn-helix domain-containing protein n=1 Tax=Odinarchaeota yellowstonii (strain LCB_4) TaxID=1841599 RepID=A0AAF0D242_ODILC|nr:MAG: helix-turn-helix domain-containing protein [Candidatus Odinarchaeum yellowstonii]